MTLQHFHNYKGQLGSKDRFGKMLRSSLLLLACSIGIAGITIVSYAQDGDVSAVGIDANAIIAAKQKKANDLIATAVYQNKKKMFSISLQTLETCAAISDLLLKQRDSISTLHAYATEGLSAQDNAKIAIEEGAAFLEKQAFNEASLAFESIVNQREFLDEDIVAKAHAGLNTVQDQRKIQHKQWIKLYKQSAKQFKKGQIDEAKNGFTLLSEHGAKFSFFEVGSAKSVDNYLTEIEAVSNGAHTNAELVDAELILINKNSTNTATEETVASAQDIEESVKAETTANNDAPVATKKKKKSGWSIFQNKKDTLEPEQIEEAQAAVENGQILLKRKRWDEAKAWFKKALVIDPENSEATNGYNTAIGMSNSGISPTPPTKQKKSILDDAIRINEVRIAFIETQFESARNNIQQLLSKLLFDEAIAQVNKVRTSIESAKQLIGPERYRLMLAQCRMMTDEVDSAKKESEETVLLQQIEEGKQIEQTRQDRVNDRKNQKIQELLHKAKEYSNQREYGLAARTLEQLLIHDPTNREALWMKDSMDELSMLKIQKTNKRKKNEEQNKVLTDAVESSIPYADLITYGDDWEELSARRLEALEQYENREDQSIYIAMANKWSPDFQQQDLEMILDSFEQESGLNLTVLWPSLELAGIVRDEPVDLSLKNVTFEKSLNDLLEYVSSGGKLEAASYVIDAGGIKIAAESALEIAPQIKIYYVADLLSERSDVFNSMLGGSGSSGGSGGGLGGGSSSRGGGGGSSRGGSSGGSSRGGGGSSRGGGGSSRGGGSSGGRSGGSSGGRSGGSSGGSSQNGDITSRSYELIDTIKYAVGIEQWAEDQNSGGRGSSSGLSGGSSGDLNSGVGTIEPFNGINLIVKQTPSVHREIRAILKKLRSTLGEQVSIEVRFLLINNNYLEDIGVDLDLYLNLGNSGYDATNHSTPFSNGYDPDNHFSTPIDVVQSHYDSGSESTAVPGSLGGGELNAFTLSGSYLDNIQVDFLIRATQGNRRSQRNNAPHVTVYNAEQATVSFGTSFNYVARLEAKVDTAVGIYEPEIDSAFTGMELLITPIISYDKRYVSLNIEVRQEEFLGFDEFQFAGETESSITQVNADGVSTTNGSGSGASSGKIQLPIELQNIIQTHVSIPDGGTLLLGGQKVVAEIEKEIGVPALSKIPILKRLFTNRNKTQDESVLLILVKPKIILQSEEEEFRNGNFDN